MMSAYSVLVEKKSFSLLLMAQSMLMPISSRTVQAAPADDCVKSGLPVYRTPVIALT